MLYPARQTLMVAATKPKCLCGSAPGVPSRYVAQPPFQEAPGKLKSANAPDHGSVLCNPGGLFILNPRSKEGEVVPSLPGRDGYVRRVPFQEQLS